MKLLPCLCLAPAAALYFSLGNGVTPCAGGPPKAWTPAPWKVPSEQYDMVKSVDASAKKLSIQHMGGKDKQERDLTVDAFTEITVQDKKATLADLKPGMRVKYVLGGSGSTLASLMTVEPPKPPPTPVATATPSFPGKH